MLRLPSHLKEGMRRMKEGTSGVADTVPVFAQICHHAARLAGESTRSFYTDAEIFLRCELAADELYGIDAPTIHYDQYNIEAEAVGARLTWNEGEVPAIDHSRPLLDSVEGFERLRVPRIGAAGRMPYVLEISKRLMDLGLAPKVRFTGVFTLAANLVGIGNLILAACTVPDRVHRLLWFLTDEVVAPWIICQRESGGRNETATGADAFASIPVISMDIMREFVMQYYADLDKRLGKIRAVGLWGESFLPEPRQLLDLKREWGGDSIQVLDPDATTLGPAYYGRYAHDSGAALTMGIDAHLVTAGPVEAIKSRARDFIEEAGRHGRFVLFINDVTYDAPPEHVHAVVSTAREYVGDAHRGCYVRRDRG